MSVVALVVDDSLVIRHTICRFLEERGYAVEIASNGREAMQIASRSLPSLIITDMQMPTMSGGEFITALKANPATVGIPIIILTGHSSGYDRGETRAEFTIFKDIDIQEQLDHALKALAKKTKAQSSGT